MEKGHHRKLGTKKRPLKWHHDLARLQLGKFGFEEKKTIPAFGGYPKKWLKGHVKVCTVVPFTLQTHVDPEKRQS